MPRRNVPHPADGAQRWRAGRAHYRCPDEVIATHQYEVAAIADDRTAKAFVTEHHYSRSYPAARFRMGLYRRDLLVGVAVYSHPVNDRVLDVLPVARGAAVELGRFVLLDNVPGNGETFFLARTFELLRREEIAGVVSFSDPQPRRTLGGELVLPGHVGRIYQAHNAVYVGRGTARTLRLLPDGRVFSDRAIAKIRAGHRGWRYASDQLVSFGARPLAHGEDARAWLSTWLPQLTRPVRHRGNHKYVWALAARLRRRLPSAQAYPKCIDTLEAW
jgi:hypothetical protein